MTSDSVPPPSPQTKSPPIWSPKNPIFWVGIFLILVCLSYMGFLVNKSDDTDPQWSHLIYVYGGVEAIAFSVVGAFFGTTVQRSQVEDANAKAEAAERREQANQVEADIGQATVALMRSKAKEMGLVAPPPEDAGEEYDDEQVGAASGHPPTTQDGYLLQELLAFESELRSLKNR